MDFGGDPSMNGIVALSSDIRFLCPSSFSPIETEPRRERGMHGSGFSKHDRCDGVDENERSHLKTAKGDPMFTSTSAKAEPCFLGSISHPLFPEGETMVSFSSANSATELLSSDWALSSYHPSPSSSSTAPFHHMNAEMGYGCSDFNMLGGTLTSFQWMEPEHKALIYKNIEAKVPIPSSLLIPIRKNLNPSLFPFFSARSDDASAGTRGSFPLGFSGSSDPEPGRCHRTDGKKWRCSRDAVADQRYCNWHLNHGRHRSRKHVEGHIGYGTKAAMPTSTNLQSASAVFRGNSSNRKSLHPSMMEHSPVQMDRLLANNENMNAQARSSSAAFMPLLIKQNPPEETFVCPDSELICPYSLVNHPHRSSYLERISFAVSNSEMNDKPSNFLPVGHFFDDLPKNISDCSTASWANMDETQIDKTQLSIPIPKVSSGISSSSSSPNQGKLNNGSQRYLNWIPISCEPTIGGPLGEVLTNKSRTPKDLISRNFSSSSLNLLNDDGWNSSPRSESSPTAVLQKTIFGSLSSSARSSPREENNDKAQISDEM